MIGACVVSIHSPYPTHECRTFDTVQRSAQRAAHFPKNNVKCKPTVLVDTITQENIGDEE
jgi:hypothetical protein